MKIIITIAFEYFSEHFYNEILFFLFLLDLLVDDFFNLVLVLS